MNYKTTLLKLKVMLRRLKKVENDHVNNKCDKSADDDQTTHTSEAKQHLNKESEYREIGDQPSKSYEKKVQQHSEKQSELGIIKVQNAEHGKSSEKEVEQQSENQSESCKKEDEEYGEKLSESGEKEVQDAKNQMESGPCINKLQDSEKSDSSKKGVQQNLQERESYLSKAQRVLHDGGSTS